MHLAEPRRAAGRLAKRPAVSAVTSIAALLYLTTQLPHTTAAGPHGSPAFPSSTPAAASPPAVAVGVPTVRTISVVVDGHRESVDPSGLMLDHLLARPSPIATPPLRRPCSNVNAWGSIARVVASPPLASSVWSQARSLGNAAAPDGDVSEDTGGSPYAVAAVAPTQQRPVSFVLPGGGPGELFASDGTTLLRSENAGCSWTPSLSLDPTGVAGSVGDADGLLRVAPGYVFTALSARGAQVYATIGPPWWSSMYAETGGAPLVVAVSQDHGDHWSASVPRADQPVNVGASPGSTAPLQLPAGSGYPQLLAVAPSDPRVVFLETASSANPAGLPDSGTTRMRLFVSRDAGRSWALATAPVRPGGGSNATPLYAAGTTETYLSQLRIDPRDPGTLYGLGVEAAPGTTPSGANGLDGTDTQNGLFESDGTLYVGSSYGRHWSALASPIGPTGYAGSVMVYVDAFAVAAGVDPGAGRVALVEHYLSPASHSLTSAIFSSADGGRRWRELPVPAALQVFLPADEGAASGGQIPVAHWGPQRSALTIDGVYDGSQPLWLTLLPRDGGLSLGIDPAPGIPSARVSIYHRRWTDASWTRVMTLPVSDSRSYDVRDWAFNPVAPTLDSATGIVYALVDCRSAVNALATANGAASGKADVSSTSYETSVSLMSYRA